MTQEQLNDVNDALNRIGIENVQNIIIIKNGATNGEVFKSMFPQWNLREEIGYEYKLFGEKHKFEGLVDEDWWNTPYGEVGE